MKGLGILFTKIGGLSKRLFDKIARTVHQPEPTLKDMAFFSYCEAGGEQLRFNYYGLDNYSVIFDLGGYQGQWASDMYSRFKSKIYIFEVYTPYFNNITNRFIFNNDIQVYNYGLSADNTTALITIDEFSTSAFKQSDHMTEIKLQKASEFVSANNLSKIDLMKINIEGGEYELLGHLIDSGIITIIDNIQVQFHDFVPDAVNKMNMIRQRLSVTHYPTYQFDFIWDNWAAKKHPTVNQLNDRH